MRRFDRRTLGAAVASLAASVVTPAGATVGLATKLYVGHAARLTARIPASWSVDPNSDFDYLGDDGFFVSEPVAGATLDEACAALAASWRFDRTATVTPTTWTGGPARRVSGQSAGADAVALVVPHLRPFEHFGELFAFAAVTTDPAHLDEIAATIDFSPDRVTPAVYFASVLDLVEARAYWASDVDWELTRRTVLASIEGLETVEEAQGALLGILDTLRAAGDNHSRLVLSGGPIPLSEASGFGMLVGGRQVVTVFPDGPAARAGVLVGDIVVSVDGTVLAPMPVPVDPIYSWGPSVELKLQRPGSLESLTVAVDQRPYDRYVPPAGNRLAGGVGYVALPGFHAVGRETEYAATADNVMASIDESPTRGWIIDLRLNDGGFYSPMVTGVGPILGDGIFVGWRSADGRQSWVSYDDGRIADDGDEISNYLDLHGPHELRHPDPPVAVLTGPLTGSSGEVTTLAFVGRPGARLFGERTGGFTTANQGFTLFDGAVLLLAVAAMTDRTGATQLEGIEPDQVVATDWTTYGTDDDPVIAAAVAWLDEQPACGDDGDG